MTTDYTTRLPNQFEDSENLRILIGIMAELFEESNEILRYLRDDTTLDDAEGVWLDEIGDIVGVARGAGQREDATIFTYCDASVSPGDPLKGFSDLLDDPMIGGHYNGIDGIPDGTVFSDADYRTLIRAKVASTYSGDSIPEMWTWINDVFDIDAFVYDSGPAEVGIDLTDYLTHTQRRILLNYIPRAAGVGISVLNWPVEPIEIDEDALEIITDSCTLTDESATHQYIDSAIVNGVVTMSPSDEYAEGTKMYHIKNRSDTPWTVVDGDANLLCTIYPDGEAWIALVDAATEFGTWDVSQHGNPIMLLNERITLAASTPTVVDTRLIAVSDIDIGRGILAVWSWVMESSTEVNSGTVRSVIAWTGAVWVAVSKHIEASDVDSLIPTFAVAAALDVNGHLAITLTATTDVVTNLSIGPDSLLTVGVVV